jgi:signal transduction histidine kinase
MARSRSDKTAERVMQHEATTSTHVKREDGVFESGFDIEEICHDQRNLLYVVTAKAGILAERDIDDPVFKETMPKIIDGLRRLRAGLDLLRKPRTPIHLDIAEIDVPALLDGVLTDVLELPGARWAEFKTDVADEARRCRADARWLGQALMNLTKNAVEATEGRLKPKIHVHASRTEAGDFRIKVIDNGVGMTEANLKRAFDSFFSTKGAKGHGLGLALTRKVIELHRGRIEVQSTEDVGTVFTVLIPQ